MELPGMASKIILSCVVGNCASKSDKACDLMARGDWIVMSNSPRESNHLAIRPDNVGRESKYLIVSEQVTKLILCAKK